MFLSMRKKSIFFKEYKTITHRILTTLKRQY